MNKAISSAFMRAMGSNGVGRGGVDDSTATTRRAKKVGGGLGAGQAQVKTRTNREACYNQAAGIAPIH